MLSGWRRHPKAAVTASGDPALKWDTLALENDLDGARRQPHLDFAAGEAIGDAVEMRLDLDVVIDAGAWALSPRA